MCVGGPDPQIKRMFEAKGYIIVGETNTEHDPDFLIFDGGPDVSPFLFGEKVLPGTVFDIRRDMHENITWRAWQGVPKVGICRGGQFLNIMNGGFMYQDCDYHTQEHKILDAHTGQVVNVTSTHHQMMVANRRTGFLVAYAQGQASYVHSHQRGKLELSKEAKEPEVIWYPGTADLCVQFHPEYTEAVGECRDYFWSVWDRYMAPAIEPKEEAA